jgi:GTP pyrophosphokinase
MTSATWQRRATGTASPRQLDRLVDRTALTIAPTGRRVRARLARFNAPWQSPQIAEVLEPLIATPPATHPKADGRLLQRPTTRRPLAHGQFRKSGDPYITHPLAVATILADLGMDTTTLGAWPVAARHRSRTPTTRSSRCARTSIRDRAAVDGVTKARPGQAGRRGQGGDDPQDGRGDGQGPRVLVIKLADRCTTCARWRSCRSQAGAEGPRDLEILAPLATGWA